MTKYTTCTQRDGDPHVFQQEGAQEFEFLNNHGVVEHCRHRIVIWTSFNEACCNKNGHATSIDHLKPQAAIEARTLAKLLGQLKNVVIIATDGETAEHLWDLPGVAPVCDYLNNILKESGHMVINAYFPLIRERQMYDGFHFKPITENAILCWKVVRAAIMIQEYMMKVTDAMEDFRIHAGEEYQKALVIAQANWKTARENKRQQVLQ